MSTIQNQITENVAPIENLQSTLNLAWTLGEDATEVVARYCSHCGKVVNFSDSGYRRQNANGKNIFHFAIYKCEKNHTWNKKLEQFTAIGHLTNVPLHLRASEKILRPADDIVRLTDETFSQVEGLELRDIKAFGYDSVQIAMSVSGGKHRLDKVLGDRLENLSRTQLVKHIETGVISVDGKAVKGKTLLRHQQVIKINLTRLTF